MVEAPRWNSNLHALEILLREIPYGAESGLDVGCGEGESSRRLRQHVRELLSDADVRRLPYFRYGLTWHLPADVAHSTPWNRAHTSVRRSSRVRLTF